MSSTRVSRVVGLALLVALSCGACRSLPFRAPRPPHRVESPFVEVRAASPEAAAAAHERIARLRADLLEVLPKASTSASYVVLFHDHKTYDRVRLVEHSQGHIVRNPFSRRATIHVPEYASEGTLAHELTHAHFSSFWRPLTRFMEEGVAEYVADELDPTQSRFADAIVFFGRQRQLQREEFRTLVFRYPDGSPWTMSSGSAPQAPAPLYDPLRALAAPSEFFDLPFGGRDLPAAYAASAILMRRAIEHGDAPFSSLAKLCEEARASRLGILDAEDVFALAGFEDVADFHAFIEASFPEAWLDSRFSASELLDHLLKIEEMHERTFETPAELFEVAGLRYLRGEHSIDVPESTEQDDPGFRDHVEEIWPAVMALREDLDSSDETTR